MLETTATISAEDRAALEAKMRLLNEKMDELAMDLKAESLGDLSGLSAEDIASRIEDFLKERPR